MRIVNLVDYFGTVVFAFTGALVAGRKRMDVFGIAVVGLVTAVGGGSLRDVLIGAQPVFWITRPIYLLFAMGGVLIALATFRLVLKPGSHHRLLLVADAVGLGAFAVIGAQKALEFRTDAAVAVLLGTFTAVMGGIFRDILCGREPLILRKEVYATACIAGASLFVLARHLDVTVGPAMCAGGAATFGIRMVAVHYGLSLPHLDVPPEGTDE